jgi:chaperonin GroES
MSTKVSPRTKSKAAEPVPAGPPFRPHGARLLVKPVAAEQRSPGGILLVSDPNNQREVKEAIVIALGDGQRMADGKVLAMTFKIGQKVYYPRFVGNEFEYGKEKYVIIGELDVLGSAD